jgi:tetratricopeptide (TPR) repeat protein
MVSVEDLLKQGQRDLNLGNPKEAMISFEKILETHPNHIDALIKKGNMLGKIGKYQQAIECYDMVLLQNKVNILALVNKGLAHHYIEQYEAAIHCYDMVLGINPKSTTSLYNKASSLVKVGRIGEGLQILGDVAKMDFSFKVKAKFDIDFADIHKNNEFKKIIL